MSRRRIFTEEDDIVACAMVELGYSNHYIREETSAAMSDAKIGYRLRFLDMKTARADYRNGKSTLAKQVYRGLREEAERRVRRRMSPTLGREARRMQASRPRAGNGKVPTAKMKGR